MDLQQSLERPRYTEIGIPSMVRHLLSEETRRKRILQATLTLESKMRTLHETKDE